MLFLVLPTGPNLRGPNGKRVTWIRHGYMDRVKIATSRGITVFLHHPVEKRHYSNKNLLMLAYAVTHTHTHTPGTKLFEFYRAMNINHDEIYLPGAGGV